MICRTLAPHEWVYLHHFEDYVLRDLPVNPEAIRSIAQGRPSVLCALMALGAANLAVLHGTFGSESGRANIPWSPNELHKNNALRLTGMGLSMSMETVRSNAIAAVATHLILSLAEVHLGTYDGLRQYCRSIEDMIFRTYDSLSDLRYGNYIVSGVANLRTTMRVLAGSWHPARTMSDVDQFWLRMERGVCPDSIVMQDLASDALLIYHRLVLFKMMLFNLESPSNALGTVIQRLLPQFYPS